MFPFIQTGLFAISIALAAITVLVNTNLKLVMT